MAEPGDFFVGTLRDHDDEQQGRIPLSRRRQSSPQDAAGAAAPAAATEAAGIQMHIDDDDDASTTDGTCMSISEEERRRKSGGSIATSLCTLQALADMCLSDTEMDLDDNNNDNIDRGTFVPKVNTTPAKSVSNKNRSQHESKEPGLGGTLRRHARRLSSIYSAAASSGDGDDDSSSSDEDQGFAKAFQMPEALRPTHRENNAFRRHSLPHVRSESSFGHLEQGGGSGGRAATFIDEYHYSYYHQLGRTIATTGAKALTGRRSSLPPSMPKSISCYDARTSAPTGTGPGDRRRSSYHTADSDGSGTNVDRHNNSSSSSSRSTLYDDDGGLGLDGLEGLGTIPTRGDPKEKVRSVDMIMEPQKCGIPTSRPVTTSVPSSASTRTSSRRPFLLQALAVAAVAALCGFAAVISRTSGSGGSNIGYLPSSYDLFQKEGGHRQLEGLSSFVSTVASTIFSRESDAAATIDEKPPASVLVGERMLGPTKDTNEVGLEQRDAGVMSPASESDAERTSALMTMRRRRRWRRRWVWHQKGGSPNDKTLHRQPTREGMKKFRAAVRLYKPRYFKWIRDVGQKGRAVCTFDGKEEEPIIEGDSLDADSKGGDSKDGNNQDDGGNNNNENNIFDRPVGKGKGKGYYADREQYYNYDDASDDFAVKNSKGSKGSKGSVRTICFVRRFMMYCSSSSS